MMRSSALNRKQRLSHRLALYVLLSISLILVSAFGYNYYYSKKLVLKNVRETATKLTQSLVYRFETKLQSVEQVPNFIALRLERESPPKSAIKSMISDLITHNPDIFGSTVAFEPYAMEPERLYFAPYFFRNETGQPSYSELGEEAYHYFHWPWYSVPKQLDRAVWSEPYFDEGGGDILMCTYSVPFYRQTENGRKFWGVVTADISLKGLVRNISELSLYQSGYAFLISRSGQFVAHPDENRIMRESIFSVAEEKNMPELQRIGEEMVRGGEGFADIRSVHTGVESLLYYAPVPTTGWSVGVMIPREELYADIVFLNHSVLLIGGIGLSILFLVVIGISRSITRPLLALVGTTMEIAKGNLDASLPPIRVNDEVGQLSRSVDEMRLALKEYISDLTETTRAKERIESELKIARNIQMSFLPKRFPPFPDRREFGIYAVLEPAKQVGGDLYDFFLLDDEHLFFSVGDVSDKGVPAALYMAVTKTLMKGIAELGLEPSEILTKVNTELCHGNDSSMFVTLFCGILNLCSGELRYTNAGHIPPLLQRIGQAPQRLTLPYGLFLGGMEEAVFKTETITLQPGDKLLVYTDGVTEAMNPAQELYSENRLREEIKIRTSAGLEELVTGILQTVRLFSNGIPQSDDIALMALLYSGMADQNARISKIPQTHIG